MLEVGLEDEDGDGGIDHPHPKDLMFDPWLTLSPSHMPLAAGYIGPVVQALAPTGRSPRLELIQGVSAVVPTLMANLVLLHGARPEGSRLVVTMEHARKTRYDRPGMRKLPEVVKVLAGSGVLERFEHTFKKRRTTIVAGSDLRRLLMGQESPLAGLRRVEGEEVLQLVARPAMKRIRGEKQPKVPIDYQDTQETHTLRAEMEAINSFIAQHNVELVGSHQAPLRLYRRFTLRRPDDAPAFNLHGRLYGGFWMTLKASERHRLRIDGEPVADLDFAGMFPRLAYAHLGMEAPEGDLYAIAGLEQHREGAKAAFSALLSYETEMKSLPSRVKEKLPQGWTASRVKQAFAAHHPDLAPLFGRDLAMDLMFTESRILLSAMGRLREAGIVALPMHDGLMVQCSKSQEAKRAMESAAEQMIGRQLPVALKT